MWWDRKRYATTRPRFDKLTGDNTHEEYSICKRLCAGKLTDQASGNHVLTHLGGEVVECDLNAEKIQPLDRELLKKRDWFLMPEVYDDPMLKYARQFAEADDILIAALYWNLAFPAMLKIYLERITVSGVTFYYDDHGIPRSLCRAKRLIYVTTSGGPIFANLGFEYVQTMAAAFFGIDDILFFKAENLDVIGVDADAAITGTKQRIDERFVK